MNIMLKKIRRLCDEKKTYVAVIAYVLIFISAISLFDAPMAIGLFFIVCLTAITFLILLIAGVHSKQIYGLFLLALLVHVAAVLVIQYTGFRLGGGADFEGYHKSAVLIADRFSQGNFSLDEAGLLNDFPVAIAIVYMITTPAMIVGQLFTAFLAALSILLLYYIILEIGGSQKAAFLAGIAAVFYPSYLYFGSVLLKDTMVTPLALAGILLSAKMLKYFSRWYFLAFFTLLIALTHLRFYVGLALMFSFIISWFLIASFGARNKIVYGFAIVFLLGFAPQIAGSGYYGFDNFKEFLNAQKITAYREVTYNSTAIVPVLAPEPAPIPTPVPVPQPAPVPQPQPAPASPYSQNMLSGEGSSFVIETGLGKGPLVFIKNSLLSFTYGLLGPFPWQIRYARQRVALLETFPWYVMIAFFLVSLVRLVRQRGAKHALGLHRFAVPLLLFSLLAMGSLTLFINNYGIITRIRIPVFMALFAVMSIALSGPIEQIYEKVSPYWRRGVYRLPFIRSPFKAGQ